MKLKDTKKKRFELRLTEEEYNLLTLSAEYVCRTPTEFVRLLLKSAFTEMREILEEQEGVTNEDIETVLNNKL